MGSICRSSWASRPPDAVCGEFSITGHDGNWGHFPSGSLETPGLTSPGPQQSGVLPDLSLGAGMDCKDGVRTLAMVAAVNLGSQSSRGGVLSVCQCWSLRRCQPQCQVFWSSVPTGAEAWGGGEVLGTLTPQSPFPVEAPTPLSGGMCPTVPESSHSP